ncbi:MAG: hypothetical protein ABWY00_01710 [Dongiaceae bacterium]
MAGGIMEAAPGGATDAQQHVPDVFQLGLTMAGAISAGAYTAGVLDFLFEALAAFEKAKQEDPTSCPTHTVAIGAISGASAGGMCSALLLPALIEGLFPLPPGQDTRLAPDVTPDAPIRPALPRFYDAWVEGPDLTNGLGGNAMLGLRDLQLAPKAHVASILNATLLDDIATAALTLPATARVTPQPYITEPLHLYLTLSNLRGMPYEITFEGATSPHVMLNHGDRQHISLSGLGTASCPSKWAAADSGVAIAAGSLVGADVTQGVWRDFITAALATGAFPLAFLPRELTRSVADWGNRQWANEDIYSAIQDQHVTMMPAIPANVAKPIGFLNVDGGMIDNEPFELARWSLLKNPPHCNPRNETDAEDIVDRAVLMIDPFPEAPDFDPGAKFDAALTAVIGKLLPTFINQCRFKPGDVVAALQENIYSRFLMVPTGQTPGQIGGQAIACGLLGGFGGFIHKPFRQHDFILGRRNCQQFLRNHFALPGDFKFVKRHWQGQRANRAELRTADQKQTPGGIPFFRLIPLMGDLGQEIASPLWPRMPREKLDTIMAQFGSRADAVKDRLVAQSLGKWYQRFFAFGLWKVVRGEILDAIKYIMLQDLLLRDQLDDRTVTEAKYKYGFGHDAVTRLVLAALADPKYDWRTAKGIAAQYGAPLAAMLFPAAAQAGDPQPLTPQQQSAIQSKIEDVLSKGPPVIFAGSVVDGNRTFTLAERKPSGFSAVTSLFSKPVIDIDAGAKS